MTIDNLFTLIASIIALITSMVTLAISIWHQNYYDKKHKRIVPAVSFWNNDDNIFTRANIKNARIYTDLDKGFEILKNANLCVCIKNIEKSKINNCKVKIKIDGKLIIYNSVGIIVEDRPIIMPIILCLSSFYKLECKIDYFTEAEEHFLYIITLSTNFSDRKDEVFLKRKFFKSKKLNILNEALSLSYSFQELQSKAEEQNNCENL